MQRKINQQMPLHLHLDEQRTGEGFVIFRSLEAAGSKKQPSLPLAWLEISVQEDPQQAEDYLQRAPSLKSYLACKRMCR